MTQQQRKLISGCVSTAICVLGAACGGGMTELQSRPAEEPISIDAAQSEWWGSLTQIHKHMSIGVQNDADFLYLSLMAEDEELISQFIAQGLIVWFDATGQKVESFGVRFPLGLVAAGLPGSPGGGGFPGAGVASRGDAPGAEPDPETRAAMFERSMSGAQVLTAGGDTVRVEAGAGIEFEGRAEYGAFIYELKVPLRSGPEYPHSIGAQPGQTIAIGFVTPEIDLDEIREQMAERMPAGGPPAGGGGQPGGVGGGRPGGFGGRGFSIPSPVEEWAVVTLAAAGGP